MPPKSKKDPKKAAELAALKQQFEEQKAELCVEEERLRDELLAFETSARKEAKVLRRQETNRQIVRLCADNIAISTKMAETVKSYSIQVVKLEDELSRLNLSKEVVAQENILLKKELQQVKADDGGKKVIAQLTTRLKQVELERNTKVQEAEQVVAELTRKLSKWMTENRLLQIRQKDSETEWARRVRELEQSVVAALERMLADLGPLFPAAGTGVDTPKANHHASDPNPAVVAAAAARPPPPTATAAAYSGATERLNLFETEIERSKRMFRKALLQARDHTLGLTDDLVEVRSMHSNLSARMRAQLEACSKEQLLVILDAVSFEPSVVDYMESRWPMPRQEEESEERILKNKRPPP